MSTVFYLYAHELQQTQISTFRSIRKYNTISACVRIFNAKSGWTLLKSGTNLVVELVLYVKSQLSLPAIMLITQTPDAYIKSSFHNRLRYGY